MECKYKYKVSVIVPVYNTDKYLEEMLDSLYNQTLDNFEVILINDGSTDKSESVIKSYIEKKNADNLRYVYHKNSGPSITRNKGIDMSLGEYVCFVDSDDKLPLNALEIMYKEAISNKADIVLGGTYRFNSQDEWKIDGHFFKKGYKDVKRFKEIFWSMGPCNKLYKKTLIEHIRFPIELSYGEDQCFVMDAYLKASRIYTIDELVYYYREHDVIGSSLTAQEITNPNNVLKQVVDLWKIIKAKVDEKVENKYDAEFIKTSYLNRLIKVNVWGPLKNAIDTKNNGVQIKALSYLLELLINIDERVFNDVFILHRLCTAWIIDRYLSLSNDAKKIYLNILIHLFSSLDNNSYNKIRKKYPILVPVLKSASEKRSLLLIRKYLFHRKVKKVKKEKTEKLKVSLRNPILKIGAWRGVDENKLILATNKNSELIDNLWYIEQKAKEMMPNLNINFYGKKNRDLIETIKMYWDFSNAKNIVIDDYYNQLYNARLSNKTNVVQVWHACGAFKKFGFSAIGYKDSNSLEFERNAHSHYTHVVSSCKEIKTHYAEAFGLNEESVVPIGVPRTDIFFDEDYKSYIKTYIKEKYPQLKNKKIVIYAPTFRGNAKDRKSFSANLDYEYWYNNVPEDTVLILKMHPSVAKQTSVPKEYADKIIDLSKLERIEDLLIVSDVLISDYSSLVFEFALMNKPMVFYAYDLDDYIDERNFYYEYTEFAPGKIVKTVEELVNVINNSDYNIDRLDSFKKKFFDHFDGKSAERFCKEFIKK